MHSRILVALVLAGILAATVGGRGIGNINCKCPKKKKVCENLEKPVFQKGQPPCTDGSRPRCPAKRCSSPSATIEDIIIEIDSLEHDLTTESTVEVFVTDLSISEENFSNGEKSKVKNPKCKCPRKRKVCENGEKPVFKKVQHPCKDGSKPRCPAKRCSKPIEAIEEPETQTDIIEVINDQTPDDPLPSVSTEKQTNDFPNSNENNGDFLVIHQITESPDIEGSVTTSVFSTEKNVDPFPQLSLFPEQIHRVTDLVVSISTTESSTEKHVDPVPELATFPTEILTEGPSLVEFLSTTRFSTEKHVDPFPELATFPTEEDRIFPPLLKLKLEANMSNTPQCLKEEIISCRGVQLDTDLIESLTPGRIVMFLEGTTDFTMELLYSSTSSTSSSVSYSFILSKGGSATMTVKPSADPEKEPSVFASINTHGKWIYFVESCGDDCTLVYQRDRDYFNKFEDK